MQHSGKIDAIIQARMTSTRLPGKVLRDLAGKPALERMIERVRRSRHVREVIIATTTNPQDDVLAEFGNAMGVGVYRGSEFDVLSRVLEAAWHHKTDLIVELTGDCPLVDHRHIDAIIDLYFSGAYDFASNTVVQTFPDGFDVRIFPTTVLEQVDQLTQDYIDRVHVSYYIYTHPEQFRLVNYPAEGRMHRPELALVLDEPDDLKFLDILFTKLLEKDVDFSAEEIVDFLNENPDVLAFNAHVRRKLPHEG